MSDGVSGSVSVQVQRSVSQKAEEEPFLPVSSTSNKKLTATLRDSMELTPINTNVTDTPSSFYAGKPCSSSFSLHSTGIEGCIHGKYSTARKMHHF